MLNTAQNLDEMYVSFRCDECQYAAADMARLRRHQRVHTGARPYECPVCHLRFAQGNTLTAHVYVSYKKLGKVSFYRATHKPKSERKLYACEHCGRTLTRRTDLRNHIKVSCGKKYSFKQKKPFSTYIVPSRRNARTARRYSPTGGRCDSMQRMSTRSLWCFCWQSRQYFLIENTHIKTTNRTSAAYVSAALKASKHCDSTSRGRTHRMMKVTQNRMSMKKLRR